jgi:hypothetical protein
LVVSRCCRGNASGPRDGHRSSTAIRPGALVFQAALLVATLAAAIPFNIIVLCGASGACALLRQRAQNAGPCAAMQSASVAREVETARRRRRAPAANDVSRMVTPSRIKPRVGGAVMACLHQLSAIPIHGVVIQFKHEQA